MLWSVPWSLSPFCIDNYQILFFCVQFHILYVNKTQKEQIRDTRVPSQGVTVVLTTLWYEKTILIDICNSQSRNL